MKPRNMWIDCNSNKSFLIGVLHEQSWDKRENWHGTEKLDSILSAVTSAVPGIKLS